MRATVLTLGTELTRGELVDTNAAWLAGRLTELGFEVAEIATVDDHRARIVAALARVSTSSDVVIVTGGLGPTTDDLTAECAAAVLGVPLVRHAPSLEAIRARFAARGRVASPTNEKQADLPEGAVALPNGAGTAPGFLVAVSGALCFFLPGVPREMKRMFDAEVAPRIADRPRHGSAQVRLQTFGLPESVVGERLAGIEAAHPGVLLGYRAHFPEVEVKVLARAGTRAAAEEVAARATAEVRARLGDAVWGEGDAPFARALGDLLRARRLTLAVAESCTGGLVGHLLTREPGASAFLLADLVTYSNSAKTTFVGVPEALLAAHGAVSAEVARAMAEGARARAGADLGLALTGVAGPDGGSEEKPVGTFFVAVATATSSEAERVYFPHDRAMVQAYAARVGLDRVARAARGATVA